MELLVMPTMGQHIVTLCNWNKTQTRNQGTKCITFFFVTEQLEKTVVKKTVSFKPWIGNLRSIRFRRKRNQIGKNRNLVPPVHLWDSWRKVLNKKWTIFGNYLSQFELNSQLMHKIIISIITITLLTTFSIWVPLRNQAPGTWPCKVE